MSGARHDPEDRLAVGIFNGVLFSIPTWCLLALIAHSVWSAWR